MRSDAKQGEILGLTNFGSGLIFLLSYEYRRGEFVKGYDLIESDPIFYHFIFVFGNRGEEQGTTLFL